MAVQTEWSEPVTGRKGISCLSSDTKPDAPAGSILWETDTGLRYERDGTTWQPTGTGGAAHVFNEFKPSSYDGDLTMNGTAQSVAVASGATRLRVVNRGATTEAIRVAFGTNAANAEANLTISAAAATTGYYILSPADGGTSELIGIPANATHYAVANAVAADVQVVSITQGV